MRTLLADVDELASVHALCADEDLLVEAVLVGVAEDNLGEGSTTSGVMDDLLNETTNVARTLGEVEGAELGGTDAVGGVGLEIGLDDEISDIIY